MKTIKQAKEMDDENYYDDLEGMQDNIEEEL